MIVVAIGAVFVMVAVPAAPVMVVMVVVWLGEEAVIIQAWNRQQCAGPQKPGGDGTFFRCLGHDGSLLPARYKEGDAKMARKIMSFA
jgi:hypothetical protein